MWTFFRRAFSYAFSRCTRFCTSAHKWDKWLRFWCETCDCDVEAPYLMQKWPHTDHTWKDACQSDCFDGCVTEARSWTPCHIQWNYIWRDLDPCCVSVECMLSLDPHLHFDMRMVEFDKHWDQGLASESYNERYNENYNESYNESFNERFAIEKYACILCIFHFPPLFTTLSNWASGRPARKHTNEQNTTTWGSDCAASLEFRIPWSLWIFFSLNLEFNFF